MHAVFFSVALPDELWMSIVTSLLTIPLQGPLSPWGREMTLAHSERVVTLGPSGSVNCHTTQLPSSCPPWLM